MNDIFVLDIETTGTDLSTDHVLEIGIVHAKKMEAGQFFLPKSVFRAVLPSDKKPSSWAAAYPGQVELYRQCNEFYVDDEHRLGFNGAVSGLVEEFLRDCGVNSPMFSGLNIVGFDIAFLLRDGFLKRGSFNYRAWCLTPIIETICHINGIDSQNSKEREKVTSYLEKNTPVDLVVAGANLVVAGATEWWEHTALYDCQKELRMLNSVIAMAHAIPKLSLG